MKQLVLMALVALFSSASLASVDFGGLIESASNEQSEAHQRVSGKAASSEKRKAKVLPNDSEFTIRLVRLPVKKRTMVAKSSKVLRQRTALAVPN